MGEWYLELTARHLDFSFQFVPHRSVPRGLGSTRLCSCTVPLLITHYSGGCDHSPSAVSVVRKLRNGSLCPPSHPLLLAPPVTGWGLAWQCFHAHSHLIQLLPPQLLTLPGLLAKARLVPVRRSLDLLLSASACFNWSLAGQEESSNTQLKPGCFGRETEQFPPWWKEEGHLSIWWMTPEATESAQELQLPVLAPPPPHSQEHTYMDRSGLQSSDSRLHYP